MRVAVLSYRGNMASGGQGIFLVSLTRALAQRGLELDVFVGPPYPDPMPWARVFRLENQQFWGKRFRSEPGAFLPRPDPFRIFHPLNFYEYAVTRFGFLPELFAFSLRAAAAVVAEQRRGVRYALAHDVQSLGYGLLWLQALGLPVVSTVHHPLTVDRASSLRRDRGFSERKGTLTFYPVRTQARVARHLAAILTSSRASAAAIRSGFGVEPDRIREVGNGVDLPRARGPRPRPARPELVFIGRGSDANKGLEYLLSALALLPPEVGLRVLDAYPTDSPLERQIRALRIGDRVRFEGKLPRAELEHALATAAIAVLPSLFEGFGLPAIEALASGTPVVATSAGALPEVLEAAGAGLLVPPADPAALAKGIAQTLDDWPRAHRQALAARPRIERWFGWDRAAARVHSVYDDIVRDRVTAGRG